MVTITQLAEQKIKELMTEEKDVVGLRIYVRGGGCHGYQYGMAFESKMADDDTVIEKGDVKVIMDSQSAPLLQGRKLIMSIACRDLGSPSRIRKRRPPAVRQLLQCVRLPVAEPECRELSEPSSREWLLPNGQPSRLVRCVNLSGVLFGCHRRPSHVGIGFAPPIVCTLITCPWKTTALFSASATTPTDMGITTWSSFP